MIAKRSILYDVLQNYKFPYYKILTSLEPTGTLLAHINNFTIFIHQFPINVFLTSIQAEYIKGIFASHKISVHEKLNRNF